METRPPGWEPASARPGVVSPALVLNSTGLLLMLLSSWEYTLSRYVSPGNRSATVMGGCCFTGTTFTVLSPWRHKRGANHTPEVWACVPYQCITHKCVERWTLTADWSTAGLLSWIETDNDALPIANNGAFICLKYKTGGELLHLSFKSCLVLRST